MLDKPQGRKPRDSARRVRWALRRYGDLVGRAVHGDACVQAGFPDELGGRCAVLWRGPRLRVQPWGATRGSVARGHVQPRPPATGRGGGARAPSADGATLDGGGGG